MLEALKRWRRRRVLERSAIPDALWSEALSALPFVTGLGDAERARLRDLVVLFLDRKSIVGAGGHEVTPLQRVVIAMALATDMPTLYQTSAWIGLAVLAGMTGGFVVAATSGAPGSAARMTLACPANALARSGKMDVMGRSDMDLASKQASRRLVKAWIMVTQTASS